DALLCGCLTAFLSRLGLKISRGHAVAGSIVFTCLLLLSEERRSLGLYFGGLTVIAIAAGFSLLWLLQAETAIHCAFRLRPLTWIGQISYSLYLWHYPIVKIMQVFPRSIFITILTLLLVFVAASASFYFVEEPFLRLKGSPRTKESDAPAFMLKPLKNRYLNHFSED